MHKGTIKKLLASVRKQIMAKTMGDALKETYLNSKQAKTTAVISLLLSLAALVAAGVSAYFSFQDSKTDGIWQMQQISTLNKLIDKHGEQNEKLRLLLLEILETEKIQVVDHKGILEFIKSKQQQPVSEK